MRNEIADIVGKVIHAVDGALPVENITDARELLDHDEWGEALSLIYTQLYEYDVKISRSVFKDIELAGNKMGLDSKEWEVLEVEG
jgi:hypothetical protein